MPSTEALWDSLLTHGKLLCLTPGAILRSLSRGDFYSSTGVALRTCHVAAGGIRLEIAPAIDRRFMIAFIGSVAVS